VCVCVCVCVSVEHMRRGQQTWWRRSAWNSWSWYFFWLIYEVVLYPLTPPHTHTLVLYLWGLLLTYMFNPLISHTHTHTHIKMYGLHLEYWLGRQILEGSVKSCPIWKETTITAKPWDQAAADPSDLHRQRKKEPDEVCVCQCVDKICLHVHVYCPLPLWEKYCLGVQNGVCFYILYVQYMCVCVSDDSRYATFFSIQTKLESQLHAMPLHCFTAYTLTLTHGG